MSILPPIIVPPIPDTGIAVTTGRLETFDVIYQLLNGNIDIARHEDREWIKGKPITGIKPTGASPLAVIGWGAEYRLYYLDENYVIQEWIISGDKSYQGEIGKLNAKATPGSGLSAIAYGLEAGGRGEEAGLNIRVYYQEAGSNTVSELANNGHWHPGDLHITGAFVGTSLAAVTYYFQRQTQIRLYYQARDLSLKEQGHNGAGWFEGAFKPGQASTRTPLAALAFGGVELQVYWRDVRGRVVFDRNTGSWGQPVVIPPIGPGYQFAVLQTENGKRLRLYYQAFDGDLIEYASDDGGKTWVQGGLKLK